VVNLKKSFRENGIKLEKKGQKNPAGISQDKLENPGIFSQA
jgi:hypothetical protein